MKASKRFPDYQHRWRVEKETNPAQAARYVLDCTRQLLAAYIKTAEMHHCLGALESMLPSLQRPEGPWEVFLGALQSIEPRGPYLESIELPETGGERVVRFCGRRAKKEYIPSRPSAFQVLFYLLGPWHSRAHQPVPVTLLRDWYRESLRKYYDLTDNEEFMRFAEAWVREFGALPSTCSHSELLRLGQEAARRHHIKSDKPDTIEKWSNGLIEALETLFVLKLPPDGKSSGEISTEPVNYESYRITYHADAAVVLNSIFARSSGEGRLDDILFGGIVIPENPAPAAGNGAGGGKVVVSISGPPGAGKTCLALSVAVQAAARGGICLYLRLSQDANSIRRQIASFYRTKRDFIEIASRYDDLPASVERCRQRSQGLLWIDAIPSGPEEMKRRAYDLVRDQAIKHFADKEKIVVFDSIGLASVEESQRAEWRRFLAECSNWLRALDWSSVFVIERDIDDGSRFEDFPLDLCFRLRPRPSAIGNYLYRTLEVTKSRHQLAHRGEHTYTIQVDAGLRLAPSSAAVLAGRRRSDRPPPEQREGIDPGVSNFALYLGGKPRSTDPAMRYWKRESVTALIGPAGTSKRPIANAFITHIDSVRPQDQPVCNLMIHFADEDQAAGVVTPQRQLGVGLRYDVTHQFRHKDGSEEEYQVVHLVFRSSHYSGGQILDAVQGFITQMRHAQCRIDRAVIIDTANLAASFPGLTSGSDPMFLPALCDLLTGHHVTLLLVHSTHHKDEDDEILQQLQNLTDTTIITELQIDRGRNCVSIHVKRSPDGSHDRGVYELETPDPYSNDASSVRITNTFDLVANMRAPVLEQSDIYIVLDAGTELQQSFFSMLERDFQRLNLNNHYISIRQYTEAFFRRAIPPGLIPLHQDLRLVLRESSRLPVHPWPSSNRFEHDLKEGQSPEQYEVLWSSRPDWSKTINELVYMDHATEEQRTKREVLWIPCFLNPSFLVARGDFLESKHARDYGITAAIQHQDPKYSWRDLIAAAQGFTRELNERRSEQNEDPIPLFDFADETSETLNCLFLEIVYSLAAGDVLDDARPFQNHFDRNGRSKGYRVVIDAIMILRSLLSAQWKGQTVLGPWKKNRNAADQNQGWEVDRRAVFSRHWYSTYRQMFNDLRASVDWNPVNAANPKLLRLPGGVWGNGDWCFTVLKGSIGTETATNLILDYFVNPTQSHSMMMYGVGLTPMADFYRRDGELPSSGVSPAWFQSYVARDTNMQQDPKTRVIHRSEISGYDRIAPILSAHLSFILALPSSGSDDKDRALVEEKVEACYKLMPHRRADRS